LPGRLLSAGDNCDAAGLSREIGAGVSGDLGTASFGGGLFDLLDTRLDQYLTTGRLLDSRSDGL
jgi:hypothetical protein